ncbi:MAG: hypothetical protein M3136_03025 [Thermoproteota archaeon]|nr:hypothetical protein [Thermoproteota archaeon]
MSAPPNDRLSHENQSGRPSNGKQNLDHISSRILEHGDIFFFYRPKVGARGGRFTNGEHVACLAAVCVCANTYLTGC